MAKKNLNKAQRRKKKLAQRKTRPPVKPKKFLDGGDRWTPKQLAQIVAHIKKSIENRKPGN